MDFVTLEDHELIPYLRRTDSAAEQAFNVLYHRYHIRVYNYFLGKAKNPNDADDRHQETFEKFLTSVRDGKKITNVCGFIFTIAKNNWINFELNKYVGKKKINGQYTQGIRKSISFEEMFGAEELFGSDEGLAIERNELLELIDSALSQMDEKYSGPFIDRKKNNLPVSEIAEKYNITYDGAKKRVERATKQLKKILEPYIDDLNNC